jgi:hypothetical protein
MRNRSVQAMLCTCIDCLNQKKFAQLEIIFYYLVSHVVSQKIHVLESYKKSYCTEIITQACLLRCKITYTDYSHH